MICAPSLSPGASIPYANPMTYCLGIITKHGLVMASDSRTNAGHDQATITRKMHTFVTPGERVFVVTSSGSLSCAQSILTVLRRAFDKGEGLAAAVTMYDAARVVGAAVREVSAIDRESLEKDEYTFNVNILLGGQIKSEKPGLFMIYPQGNPLAASEESPFLQIGETKYGRPILDRGIRFDVTSLEEACKYALLSLDSTMKSNVTVGPPVDLIVYSADELAITRQRRFTADDAALAKMRSRWDSALRHAVARLPDVRFQARPPAGSPATSAVQGEESIFLVENADHPEAQVQMKNG